MLAIVHRISELYPERLDSKVFPKMMDWWQRGMARPAAKAAYGAGPEVPDRPKKKSVTGITEYHL